MATSQSSVFYKLKVAKCSIHILCVLNELAVGKVSTGVSVHVYPHPRLLDAMYTHVKRSSCCIKGTMRWKEAI